MKRMLATRLGPQFLAPDKYVCGRCGIVKRFNTSRVKPELCPDCREVVESLPWVPIMYEPCCEDSVQDDETP